MLILHCNCSCIAIAHALQMLVTALTVYVILQVYDWDKSSRNDFLGCARLNLGGRIGKWDDALGVEREAWQKLINEPNVRHEFVIPLRSSADTRPFEE